MEPGWRSALQSVLLHPYFVPVCFTADLCLRLAVIWLVWSFRYSATNTKLGADRLFGCYYCRTKLHCRSSHSFSLNDNQYTIDKGDTHAQSCDFSAISISSTAASILCQRIAIASFRRNSIHIRDCLDVGGCGCGDAIL